MIDEERKRWQLDVARAQREREERDLAVHAVQPLDAATLTPPLPDGVRSVELHERSQPSGRSLSVWHKLVVDTGAGKIDVHLPRHFRRADHDERRAMLLAAAAEAARRIAGPLATRLPRPFHLGERCSACGGDFGGWRWIGGLGGPWGLR